MSDDRGEQSEAEATLAHEDRSVTPVAIVLPQSAGPFSIAAANYLRDTLLFPAQIETYVAISERLRAPADAHPMAIILVGADTGLRGECERLRIPCWSITESGGSSLGRATALYSSACPDRVELDLAVTGPNGAAVSQAFVAVGMTPRSTLRGAMAALAASIDSGGGAAGIRSGAGLAHGARYRTRRRLGVRAAAGARRAGRMVRGAAFSRAWRVGVLESASLQEVGGGGSLPVSWIQADGNERFWADPFPVIDDDGSRWIFVEEYERNRGLGRIVALRIEGAGVAERTVVLQAEHHVAFPQAIRSAGGWIATADTCESPAPVFAFTHPGARWRRVPGCHLPLGVVDPQLAEGPSGWVVAGTDRRFDGQSVARVWCRSRESSQGWVTEPNGAYVDIRYARSGGSLDLRRDLRAVQDCAGNYGMAVSLIASPPGLSTGTEPRLRRLEPTQLADSHQKLGSPLGVHTLAWTPDASFIVVDGWWRVPHPLSAYWRIRERTHQRTCAGAGADADHADAAEEAYP